MGSEARAPVNRRAARHAATSEEIIKAAWELSLQRGLAGWTLQDIGQVVGMRAPSLYGYFDGKNALYDAMFADGCRVLAELARDAPRPADPRRLVQVAGRVFVDFCVANPARFQLLFLRTLPGFVPSDESFQLAVHVLNELIAVLREAGITDPKDVDIWTALMTGIASQQISNDPGGSRWVDLLDLAIDRFLPRLEQPQ